MARGLTPTAEVARARRYAAVVRIGVALLGGLILLFDPATVSHAVPAAIGLAVIGVTGVVEILVRHERWLAVEETFSCSAAILIVAWSGGEVNAITILWLVAAATGVLARGGRVGVAGRLLVVGALLAPIVIEGPSGERVGLAAGAILLLLAVGRISRETAELLSAAQYKARHDELTGLLSRSAFRDRVDELARTASTENLAALIVLDIENFGAINKRHGTAAGDAVLRDVGAALAGAVRPGDLCGRIGGDELAVFAFSDQPGTIAVRMLEVVAAASPDFRLRAHVGYALCPFDGDNAEGLLTGGEVALRVAKRGPDHKVVVPYQGARLSDSAEGARAALESLCQGHGLEVAVQPIVDIRAGVPHAYEALARFRTGGGEGPLQWFALAEEFGMRAELELACLGKALDLLPALPAGTRLSVNLSAPLLVDPRTTALLDAEADLSSLIVEVTEDVLVRQGPEIERATQSLRSRGVEFAVDDIGAGYAGLGQLAALRPTYLKLDRALVRGADRDPSMASLIELLAAYGRSIDGMVVAEGVETEAELEVVRSTGVQLVQGFLLARPAPPWPEVAPFDAGAPLSQAAG